MDDRYKIMILRHYGHNTNSDWETIYADHLSDAELVFFDVLKTDPRLIQAKILWGDTLIHDYKETRL